MKILEPLRPRVLCVALCFAIAVVIAQQTEAETPNVPDEYRELYSGLNRALDGFAGYIKDKPRKFARASVTFGTELLPANGNRGERLLKPRTVKGTKLYLDRLQALGARGVSMTIVYPVLLPDYPHSAEYLSFFRTIADDVRRRGMTLHCKTCHAFNQRAFGLVDVDYGNTSKSEYLADRADMVRTIVSEIRPDYLTIVTEPLTEQEVTGYEIGPEDYSAFFHRALSGLDRNGVLIGAGAGSWERINLIKAFIEDPRLDYFDIHLYPVHDRYLERAGEIADLAAANGKRLVIGEAWLYKTLGKERQRRLAVTWAPIFSRDAFGFWQPMDIRFMKLVDEFARKHAAEYVSFFWSKYFFAYLDYDRRTARLSPTRRIAAARKAAAMNILLNRHSETGEAYRVLADTGSSASDAH